MYCRLVVKTIINLLDYDEMRCRINKRTKRTLTNILILKATQEASCMLFKHTSNTISYHNSLHHKHRLLPFSRDLH